MLMSKWIFRRNRLANWVRGILKYQHQSPLAKRRHRRNDSAFLTARCEVLESRAMLSSQPFTAGDIAVLQLSAATNNASGTVIELAPTGANQSAVISIGIGASGSNALRFSDSGTSSFLSNSNDGSLLVLSGYNTTDSSSSNLASTSTLNDRAVATLDSNVNFTLQTTYTGVSGNQTRSATSTDNNHWYITDKGGLYTNSATSSTLSTNILNDRSFGGTVYVSTTSQTTGVSAVSTLSSPTASSLTALPGLPTGSSADSKIQDFYLVQSGQNGSTYDQLYTLDQTSSSAASINKYYLNGSTWTSEGSYTLKNSTGTAISATSMIAEPNGNGGVNLFVVTTAQATGNAVVEYTDTAAYNATIAVNGANSTTLYTANPTSATLKGIAFAPVASTPATAPAISTPASSSIGATTVTIGGKITSSGGQNVSAYGVVYSSTKHSPTIGGSDCTNQVGTGSAPINSPFAINVTGLQSGTTYYYTAYATNSVGTSYTSVGTFTTAVQTPAIQNPNSTITIGENHVSDSVNLTGINDGESDSNASTLTFTATSTNPSLFAAGPSVTNYSSGAGTATLGFTPAANQTGSAVITVTVQNSYGNTATATYTVNVNPISVSTAPLGVFAGSNVTISSATLTASESGVSAANIQYTLTGNPPAADGTIRKNGVVLAQNGTFTQADLNSGLITYTSSGSASATDNIAFSVSESTNGGSLSGQSLNISIVVPPTSSGNLAVMDLAVAGSTNTTGAVLYLNPTTTQATPVQSIPISSMSFSDSGTSSFLSDSNDGSLLAFAAYNITSFGGADLGTDTAVGSRAVGTLNSSGIFNLATTYTDTVATSTTTEQTRSATTIDNSTWYITDKDGLYTNNENNLSGPAGPSLTTNILVTRAFGGTAYVASTKATAGVSTLSSPTAVTLSGLPGLPGDASIQDFYLIQSGTNGNTFDVLYTLDQNTGNATINKYSLVSGSWVANGTPYTIAAGATSMIATNNGSGGAALYVVTTAQAADNSVVELTDSAGWNANLNVATAPVTVYTATGTNSLKGIAFAPTSLPNFTVTASAPSSAAVGANFNYTLTATNSGPANASGVPVQFTLPAGLTYVSASAPNGVTVSQSNGVVSFTGLSLNAGASDTLTITVEADTAATYSAAVGSAVIDSGKSIAEGNEYIDNFNTSAVSTQVTNEADLTVSISGPSAAYTNQTVNYTLTASNQGTANANGDVTIQFTLPTDDAGLTYETASAPGFTVSESGGVVTFSGGSIAAGASKTLTVTVEDTTAQLVTNGVVDTNTATVRAGAAVISSSDNIPESNNNQSSINAFATTISSPFEITGVDVSPVVNTPFTGVVATFSDAAIANPGTFSATINWGDGHSSAGVVTFTGNKNVTDINGNTVTLSIYTVSGTNTYASTTTTVSPDVLNVVVTDANNNSAAVNPVARVANAALVVSGGNAINALAGVPLTNVTVATFTDPGLVAALGTSNLSNLESQFSASINWGDNSSVDTGSSVNISYNSGVFSVVGSHTYSQTGPYSLSVSVTPLTVSVERIDSSDPTHLNIVGDETIDLNGLTDSPSAGFIDQFAIGNANQATSLYTFSLPTVANFSGSGNQALTNSSYSVSEGELSLSTNGLYLVTGGYNDTVSAWSPQQTFSPASVINRVIGTISGSGVINTTTDLTDAYSGDNFRGVASTDGTNFWTVGHSSGFVPVNDYVHYTQLGDNTSTTLTGSPGASNINTVEIFNGQLYEGVRSVSSGAPAGIYQIGNGLPTTAGQSQTLFIEVPQSNPLDVTASNKPMSPFGFYLADLNNGNPTVNGVNVAYVADAEMGIARYDHTNSGWQFSYYINSTGSFLNSAYNVDSSGNITATNSFDPNNPAGSADASKVGGVRELTGRIVNGQVQLFGVTGFGTGGQPNPGGSLIEVTDTGANAGFTTLATNSGASEFTGVAFTPTQTVSSSASVDSTPASLSLSNSTVLDHSSSGTVIGTFSSTENSGTGTPYSYSLVSGVGSTDNAAFTITGNTLTINSAPNYYNQSSYSILVQTTDEYGNSLTRQFTIDVTAAPAAAVVFATVPSAGVSSVTLSPVVSVSVEDQYGHIVTGNSSSVTLTVSGGATFVSTGTNTISVNANAGVATFNGLAISATDGVYHVTASASGLTQATSGNITITQPATKLVFQTSPQSTATAGSPLSNIVVAVKDAAGNTVAADGSTVTLTLNSGMFSNGTNRITATVSNGLATFGGAAINTAGTHKLTATDSGLTQVVSGNIVVSPAAPALLVARNAPPATGVAGTVLPSVTMAIEDAFGNLVTTASSPLLLTLASGTFSTNLSTATATVSGGLATFANLKINKSGTYNYTLSDSDITSPSTPVTGSIVINPGTPAKLVLVSTLPTSGNVGVAIAPISFAVEDSNGNVVADGSSVSLTITSGSFAPVNVSATTVNGVATFSNFVFTKAGTYSVYLRATDNSFTTAYSASVTIRN